MMKIYVASKLLDMNNAFNECHREAFLLRLCREFPDLMAWVRWSYQSAGKLCSGTHQISSTAGVQQGDPLGHICSSHWSFYRTLG